jgi:thiamine-monophosphate kinase
MKQPLSLSEFDLIGQYFANLTTSREDVLLGIGDDAALLEVPPGQVLVVSVDTLVAGVHFFADVSPESLGHKSLAVNLSDLAAMGAEPAWATLALTLPAVTPSWLEAFAGGFARLAASHGLALVGGDTTRGPLSITVQVHGLVPVGQALQRRGARVGDLIYVTGSLGEAALALKKRLAGLGDALSPALLQRLEKPQPRIEAGLALRGLASSAIDLSDGLLADLGHILTASGVGARIALQQLPLAPAVADWIAESGEWTVALAGGDDYELCFTAAADHREEIQHLSQQMNLAMSCIGQVEAMPGLRAIKADGQPWDATITGFDHFSMPGSGA